MDHNNNDDHNHDKTWGEEDEVPKGVFLRKESQVDGWMGDWFINFLQPWDIIIIIRDREWVQIVLIWQLNIRWWWWWWCVLKMGLLFFGQHDHHEWTLLSLRASLCQSWEGRKSQAGGWWWWSHGPSSWKSHAAWGGHPPHHFHPSLPEDRMLNFRNVTSFFNCLCVNTRNDPCPSRKWTGILSLSCDNDAVTLVIIAPSPWGTHTHDKLRRAYLLERRKFGQKRSSSSWSVRE